MNQKAALSEFACDILRGLSSKPRFLESKYFYDEKGSLICQKIMDMPEYYLTDCEAEILENNKDGIFRIISRQNSPFELVELGAGDGLKTRILLSHFISQSADFTYIPVDISATAVRKLTTQLNGQLPGLKVEPKTGDYFDLLETMNRNEKVLRVILFLGSNIGNFDHVQTLDFLYKLRAVMTRDDLLLMGFDLKKSPEVILKAYNDPHGHTASFNLNLLARINHELQADFDLSQFRHQETYNPDTGVADSYLVSLKKQRVTVHAIGKSFMFEEGERLHTEISRKFDLDMIQALAKETGLQMVRQYTDARQYFANILFSLE